jgi:D-alanine--poly(phosphoribitol) ligase subunit 2
MEPRWTREAIMRGLGDLFVESLHVEAPPPDTDLFESATLDSLQLVELLLQLERRFGVRVAIEHIDLEHLRTLERIARLVEAASPAEISAAKKVA